MRNLPLFLFKGGTPPRHTTQRKVATIQEIERMIGVTILGKEGQEDEIQKIPIVREFSEIFPSDLPGIPPHREIEFIINLVPGTKPISIPLYCMTPKELEDLNIQLEELS
ncbi:hypothetical protein Syun_007259 [Stephania yunnanensis]|uniref:Uncharacterized protein n=1 Tax=Stephania yunnanensis TaxID=152371 RepID=A0AAP0KY69_9MAGN